METGPDQFGDEPVLSPNEISKLRLGEISKIELTGDFKTDAENLLFAAGFAHIVSEIDAGIIKPADYLRSIVAVYQEETDTSVKRSDENIEEENANDQEREILLAIGPIAKEILEKSGEPIVGEYSKFATEARRVGDEKAMLRHEVAEMLDANHSSENLSPYANVESAKNEVDEEADSLIARVNDITERYIKTLDSLDKVDPNFISEQKNRIEKNREQYISYASEIKRDAENYSTECQKYLSQSENNMNASDLREVSSTLSYRMRAIMSPLFGLNELLDELEKGLQGS
jgi:hypothetical protein